MREFTFEFTVSYKGIVRLPDESSPLDVMTAISKFAIPDGEDSIYIPDSFDVDEDSITELGEDATEGSS